MIFTAPLLAEENVEIIEAEGMADLEDRGTAQAKDMAINDALRNAVEKAIGTYVDSETVSKNYETIEDSILTKTEGYVSDYEVIDETKDETDEIYKVKIEAEVVTEILKDDIDTLELTIERANDPRVVVVIPEEHIEREIPDPAAETEIIRKLKEAGFRLVDQEQVEKARDSEEARRAASGEEDAYEELAARFDADLMVIGEAFSEFNEEYEGMTSCRARVEIRVVRADTGEILTAHGIHASGADVTESTASKKALQEAGSEMADYLLETLPEEISDTERSVQLSINSINFNQLNDLEERLKDTHLIEDVNTRDFVGSSAEIDLKTSLLPMQLAEELSSWDSPALEIKGVSGGKIEATIKED